MHNKEQSAAILARFKFDPWNLMGPRNKELRRDLIIALTGQRRPLAKCGVTEIQKILRDKIDVSQATCVAREPEMFKAFFQSPGNQTAKNTR